MRGTRGTLGMRRSSRTGRELRGLAALRCTASKGIGLTADRHRDGIEFVPLPGASFGKLLLTKPGDAAVAQLEAAADRLVQAFYAAHGFLLLRGLSEISADPLLLVRLSRLFGPEVENYRQTLTPAEQVHPLQPEILVVANRAPVNRPPPARPDPPLTAEGALPTQFPHRRGWHTDQSYRRPPPDISLFYAHAPVPCGQGQTLYADGIAAYAALPAALAKRIEGLHGRHVKPGSGRSEQAVRAGQTPQPLAAHEQPQLQPLVRTHPVTGKRALYLCEAGQLDWVDGPIAGLSSGLHGQGAALVYELMTHYTQPRFVYAHEWEPGDLVVYDNRSLIHAATWFDAERYGREMWRTTVWGNPGPEYANEGKSWIAQPGAAARR